MFTEYLLHSAQGWVLTLGQQFPEQDSQMQGLTWRKQALVRSPKRANELCLTSGIVSYIEKGFSLRNMYISFRENFWCRPTCPGMIMFTGQTGKNLCLFCTVMFWTMHSICNCGSEGMAEHQLWMERKRAESAGDFFCSDTDLILVYNWKCTLSNVCLLILIFLLDIVSAINFNI